MGILCYAYRNYFILMYFVSQVSCLQSEKRLKGLGLGCMGLLAFYIASYLKFSIWLGLAEEFFLVSWLGVMFNLVYLFSLLTIQFHWLPFHG